MGSDTSHLLRFSALLTQGSCKADKEKLRLRSFQAKQKGCHWFLVLGYIANTLSRRGSGPTQWPCTGLSRQMMGPWGSPQGKAGEESVCITGGHMKVPHKHHSHHRAWQLKSIIMHGSNVDKGLRVFASLVSWLILSVKEGAPQLSLGGQRLSKDCQHRFSDSVQEEK